MTDYLPAKHQFRNWVCQRAREYGYDPTHYRRDDVVTDESGLVFRTRATRDQGPTVKFEINDEVGFEHRRDHDYDRRFTVILDLHEGYTWDSDRDHFYPVPLWYAKREATRDRNGDYPVTFDLQSPPLRRWRDDLTQLFPDAADDDKGGDGGGTAPGTDPGPPSGPSLTDCDDQIQSLRAIAQDLETE